MAPARRLISRLRPERDETLMSFVRRTQIDADFSDNDVHLLAAGVSLADARRAERRFFDWRSLSRFFNADEEELFAMSERSFYCGVENEKPVCTKLTPWVRERGYSAHCPRCLGESPHWRRAWLQPCAAVCAEHGTLLVDHCHGCGVDLAECSWSHAAPICPECGAHLALGSVIAAPDSIAARYRRFDAEFRELTRNGGFALGGLAWSHYGAWWSIAQRFGRDDCPGIRPLRDALVSLTGLEPLTQQTTVTDRAHRRAQMFVSARAVLDLDPGLLDFFRHSISDSPSNKVGDAVIRFRLFELAKELQIDLASEQDWNVQTLLPFGNAEGAELALRAA